MIEGSIQHKVLVGQWVYGPRQPSTFLGGFFELLYLPDLGCEAVSCIPKPLNNTSFFFFLESACHWLVPLQPIHPHPLQPTNQPTKGQKRNINHGCHHILCRIRRVAEECLPQVQQGHPQQVSPRRPHGAYLWEGEEEVCKVSLVPLQVLRGKGSVRRKKKKRKRKKE